MSTTPRKLPGVPLDEFVSKKQLAERLSVTVRTIENWQREGYLPFLKISSVVLFHWPEVVENLKTHFKVCPGGVRPQVGSQTSAAQPRFSRIEVGAKADPRIGLPKPASS